MRVISINAKMPKLPRSRTDPVMSARFLKKAEREINAKYKGIQRGVIDLFNSINVSVVTVNAELYSYDIDANRLARLNERLLEILDEWLLEGYEINQLWSGRLTQEAYAQGTLLAQSNLAAISSTYATERSLSAIIFSEAYQQRIGIAYANAYSDWKGLSDAARADLADVISSAVANGRNPKTVVNTIIERIGVSKSRAQNIAQTEITGALREARWAEVEATKRELGLEAQLFWTSALLPTTRKNHAARHGNVYTTDNVRDFYSKDGNRYRCHCAQTEVIVVRGKPEIPKGVNEAYGKELNDWNKDREARERQEAEKRAEKAKERAEALSE